MSLVFVFFRCYSMQCWDPQVVIYTEMLIAVMVILMKNLESVMKSCCI